MHTRAPESQSMALFLMDRGDCRTNAVYMKRTANRQSSVESRASDFDERREGQPPPLGWRVIVHRKAPHHAGEYIFDLRDGSILHLAILSSTVHQPCSANLVSFLATRHC